MAVLWFLTIPQETVAQLRLHGFGPTHSYTSLDNGFTGPPYTGWIHRVGDVDGDGRDDLITFYRDSKPGAGRGDVEVRRFPAGFPATWQGSLDLVHAHDFFCIGDEIPATGDFNGDGRDDIVTFVRGTGDSPTVGDVYVALSDGTRFGPSSKWHDWFGIGDQVVMTGDFDGDGDDDVVAFSRGTTPDVYVALSNGRDAFVGTGVKWHEDFCGGQAIPAVGDVNGDGRDDIICFLQSTVTGPAAGDVLVALSNGSGFGPVQKWHDWFSLGEQIPVVADVNGDGRADVVTFDQGGFGRVYVALSDGSAFIGTGQVWRDRFTLDANSDPPMLAQINDDLNADLLVVQGSFPEFPGLPSTQINVAVAGGHAQESLNFSLGSVFGWGTLGVPEALPPMGARPDTVQIPLLVLLGQFNPSTVWPDSRKAPAVDQMVFGPNHPNLVAYFRDMSYGKLEFTRAGPGVVGPLQVTVPSGGDPERALLQAVMSAGVDLAQFDRNGNNDGVITRQELVILQIDDFSPASGQTRIYDIQDIGGTSLDVNVKCCKAGYLGVLDLWAHELSHSLDTLDLYSSACYCGGLSLMNCNADLVDPEFAGLPAAQGDNWRPPTFVHLDPYHRMRLGWMKPRVYDFHQFPGTALISPAQSIGTEPPILFYDSEHGLQEYYMVELRSRHGPGMDLTPGDPTDYPAGYDSGAADTPGIVFWYCHIGNPEDASNPLNIPALMLNGTNSILEATVAAGSDDILSSPVAPTPGVPVVNGLISPGPDGILQSTNVPSNSDDAFNTDWLCFPSITPHNYVSRRYNTVFQMASGPIRPEWFDPSHSVVDPVPVGVTFHVDVPGTASEPYQRPVPTAAIDWGQDFAPFIDSFYPSRPLAGSAFAIEGGLGIQDGARFAPVLADDEQEYPLTVQSWTVHRALLVSPLRLPSGNYRLFIHSDQPGLISNVLPLWIENPWLDFVSSFFPGEDLTHDEIIGYAADPDHDGRSNLEEFAFVTNPHEPDDDSKGMRVQTVQGQGMSVQWTELASRQAFVRVVAETSNDLTTWKETQPVVVQPGEGAKPEIREVFLPFTAPKEFLRLSIDASGLPPE